MVKEAVEDQAAATEIEVKKTVRKAGRKAKNTVNQAADKREKAAGGPNIIIQSPAGGYISTADIAKKVPENTADVYVRVDENKLYYVLENGTWTKLTDAANRPRIANFSAIIRPFNDKQSQAVPVVSSWAGVTMPIEGVTDEEIANSVIDAELPFGHEPANGAVFDLQGRRMAEKPLNKGIYIINNKKYIVK